MQLLFKSVEILHRLARFAPLAQKRLELIHGVGLTGQERRTLQCLHGASLRAIGCRDTNLVPEWLCPVKTGRGRSQPESINQICSPLALSVRDLHPNANRFINTIYFHFVASSGLKEQYFWHESIMVVVPILRLLPYLPIH